MDSYSYDTTYSTTSDGDAGVALAAVAIMLVVGIAVYALFVYFLGRIFKKAGEEQWKAWVPVYNNWVMLELGGQKGWLALLSLLGFIPLIGWIGSIVAYVFTAIAAYNIGLKLQKEGWFVVLYILLTPVWIIWLAFDKSTWQPSVAGTVKDPLAGTSPSVQQPETPANDHNTPPTPPIAS